MMSAVTQAVMAARGRGARAGAGCEVIAVAAAGRAAMRRRPADRGRTR